MKKESTDFYIKYINLRSSRDVTRGGQTSVRTDVRTDGRRPFVAAVGFIQFTLGSFYADCPHKRII